MVKKMTCTRQGKVEMKGLRVGGREKCVVDQLMIACGGQINLFEAAERRSWVVVGPEYVAETELDMSRK